MKTLIAALAIEISQATKGTIQLFPAGEFRAVDGRPAECANWLMNADIAQALIATAAAKSTPYVLDYEHQTLKAATNGQPAPASGWFKDLEWRDGEGLFATVDWTAAAAKYIEAEEYRYISPVFSYDKSGRVTGILHAALTNTPALDDMDAVMLAAASLLATPPIQEGNAGMDELLEQLRWMLNLPLSATMEDVIAELQKVIARLSNGEGTAAASVNLLTLLESNEQQVSSLSTQIAALTTQSQTPDPTKFVTVDTMNAAIQEAREQVAALGLQDCGPLITAALSDGRLLTAQKGWAEALGKQDPASLKSFLEKAQPIAALSQSQTQGKPPAGVHHRGPEKEGDDVLDLAVCSLLGTDPKEVAQFMKENGHE